MRLLRLDATESGTGSHDVRPASSFTQMQTEQALTVCVIIFRLYAHHGGALEQLKSS